jgi:hypothetical protein
MPNADKTTEKTYAPLTLIKNVRYPTYQLFAVAIGRDVAPETVLTIAILETMRWLRERFRDFEIPSELKYPLPEHFSEVDSSAFSSFQINEGYKVDVVWLPQDFSWSLQLTEPDFGSRSVVDTKQRPPVPGRLIETNIAYRIFSGKPECGFRTVIAEPEDTNAPCEVYRPAVVKRLARNPRVNLQHCGLRLLDEPHVVNSMASLKQTVAWLRDKDRMMPAVVSMEVRSSQATDSAETGIPLMAAFPIKPSEPTLMQSLSGKPPLPEPFRVKPQPKKCERYLLDLTPIARYKMGYAQFIHIPIAYADAFRKYAGKNFSDGETMLFEPRAFGNDTLRYAKERIERDATGVVSEIEEFTQNYPKGKIYKFGNIWFAQDAKIAEHAHAISVSASLSDSLRAFAEEKKALEQRFHNEMLERDKFIKDLEKKIIRLKEENQAQKNDRDRLIQNHRAALDAKDRELCQKDAEIARLKALPDRPKEPKDVAAWVERSFPERLIFHAKAIDLMKKLSPGETDVPLICDALEFLAIDYMDLLLNSIDKEEMLMRCLQKYNRPFDVVPVRGVAVEKWPLEYKIKYAIGHAGKPVETPLDLHLRVGTDSENLLRIYFLYDKNKKRIVVGSLPKHLPIENF